MSGTRRAGSRKLAARRRDAPAAVPQPCPECIKKTEQLRVAHVTIKYLQKQMVEMASTLVLK